MSIIEVTRLRNFSQASENNKVAILEKLSHHLDDISDVLEVGSGSGQHAMYFSEHFPHLVWQPTDMPGLVNALELNIAEFAPENVLSPLELDVRNHPWPVTRASCVYTANTLHIMAAKLMQDFFLGIGSVLRQGGLVCIYGPFKYDGEFTTSSNAAFDTWLKLQNPVSGIREVEEVIKLAHAQGLNLLNDYSMPANNQFLLFKRGQF